MEKKRLTRSNNRMIGGVCAGIADYFEWDITLVRIIYAKHTFCGAETYVSHAGNVGFCLVKRKKPASILKKMSAGFLYCLLRAISGRVIRLLLCLSE